MPCVSTASACRRVSPSTAVPCGKLRLQAFGVRLLQLITAEVAAMQKSGATDSLEVYAMERIEMIGQMETKKRKAAYATWGESLGRVVALLP